jgi:hypothetical protein
MEKTAPPPQTPSTSPYRNTPAAARIFPSLSEADAFFVYIIRGRKLIDTQPIASRDFGISHAVDVDIFFDG